MACFCRCLLDSPTFRLLVAVHDGTGMIKSMACADVLQQSCYCVLICVNFQHTSHHPLPAPHFVALFQLKVPCHPIRRSPGRMLVGQTQAFALAAAARHGLAAVGRHPGVCLWTSRSALLMCCSRRVPDAWLPTHAE